MIPKTLIGMVALTAISGAEAKSASGVPTGRPIGF